MTARSPFPEGRIEATVDNTFSFFILIQINKIITSSNDDPHSSCLLSIESHLPQVRRLFPPPVWTPDYLRVALLRKWGPHFSHVNKIICLFIVGVVYSCSAVAMVEADHLWLNLFLFIVIQTFG